MGAASWTARHYLGLPDLNPAALRRPSSTHADPRTNLDQLDTPHAVILRGALQFRR
ncbi:MAG: hypothetical protein AVDCRST_MAG75-2033 [uncultured Propionibacteriaceae bacterium]|uniref:Uncharacterized protein n=1 Tax=uncultured Propionibacteriaceae bacterium TaxID=257457 RepID=A0A6J4P0U5_9ACTN|nr:MAG: hypothetical protein AVDCRST_MAG75-2033 [uncultured Propionibacteriaceae bacterium]